jgi:hypothetical protein
MENKGIEDARDYCVEYGYFVSVNKDSNINGCMAIFPERLVYNNPIEGKITFYEITNVGVEYYCSYGDGANKTSSVECPEYSKRILIFQDILKKAFELNISPKLIVCYDENGNKVEDKKFINCLDPPEGADRELEEKFAKIFYKHLSNPDMDYSNLARLYEVEQGYNLLTLPFLKKDFE